MSSLNSFPLVGHAKGLFHYVTGDVKNGNKAMYEATKTSLVLGASVAGCAAGPAGVKAAGAAAEALCDSAVAVVRYKPIGKKGKKDVLLNFLPVVGHAKGLFQYVTGDVENGNKAMYEATIKPLVLGASVAGCAAEAATVALCDSAVPRKKNVKKKEKKDDFLNSLPVVGHAKGIYHYVANDVEEGHKAMHEATRTSVVLGASVAGYAAGPTGAKAAGAAAGALCDSVAAVACDKPGKKKERKDALLNSLPVIGHAKGVFHYVTGDVEKGNKAMYEATIKPLVLGAGVVECAAEAAAVALCDSAVTREILVGKKERKDVLNSLPAVGHAKGIFHYVTGDVQEGNKAMLEATRTSLVLSTSAVRCAAGPAGAMAADAVAEILYDSAVAVDCDDPVNNF